METQTRREYKYLRHSGKQYAMILEKAQALFALSGVEDTSIADITSACGIMRATFYRYFDNKNDVAWHVMHHYSLVFGEKLLRGVEASGESTYKRFRVMTDVLLDIFCNDIDMFRFMAKFGPSYQMVTAVKDNPIYDQFYAKNEFRTGDTVRLLETDFHDGSVKAELDPHLTAVSVMTGATTLAVSLAGEQENLRAKYGVNAADVLRLNLDALLMSLRP